MPSPTEKLEVDGVVKATSFQGDGSGLSGVDTSATNEIQNLSQVLAQSNDAGGAKIANIGAPTVNTDATNMAYVDATVAAAGTAPTVDGTTMPTMISSLSPSGQTWGLSAAYCSNLTEGGYTDWYMPNRDELVYMVAGKSASAITYTQYLWTRTMADASVMSTTSANNWIYCQPSYGSWSSATYDYGNYVRCVR